MTETNPSAAVDPAGFSAADLAAAVTTARAEARTAERARIAAILDSEAAKGRGGLARHIALSTDTTPEAAIALLDKAALETKAPSLTQRMATEPTADLGAPGAGSPPENEFEAARTRGLALRNKKGA